MILAVLKIIGWGCTLDEKVRILLVEDFPPDAELAEIEIRQSIENTEFLNVKTKSAFLEALTKFKPHVIVSDYMMPQFDGMTALKITLETTDDIPFILFTGSMNEDTAVECMKLGATDYIIKEHIKRLGGSVKNALEQRKVMLEKKVAQAVSRQSILDKALLLETANFLLLSHGLHEIYEIVFNAIIKLLPDYSIIISCNNPEENVEKVLFHKGFDKYLKWMDRLFQFDLENLKIPIKLLTEEEIKNNNCGKLLKEPEGLYGILERTISKETCYLIEKALKTKEIYTIGLSSNSQRYGNLILFKKDIGRPNKSEIIEIIIGQASQAIQKYYALESVKLNQARLQSLLTISQFKSESIQELLDKTLDEIVKLTQSKIGYIYFYYPDKELFVLSTWSKEVMPECVIKQPQIVYELKNTGIWGEAVRQGKPIIINDFSKPNSLKKGYPEGHVDLKKFLTIPVIYKNVIVAVAGVGNKITDYSESDVNQLTLMMDSVWKLVKQKETDLLLIENEEKYKAIMEQSLDNIYLADIQTMNIIEANPAICQFLGYELDEMKQLQIFDIVKSPQNQLLKLTSTLLNNKKLYLGERNYIKKNKEIVQVEANASVLHYKDKEVICVISHDITERKIAEMNLFESREKLRMILNYTPIGTGSIDDNGFLIQSNQSFKDLFALPLTQEVTNFNIFNNIFISEIEKKLLMQGEVLKLEKNYTFDQLESIFQTRMNRTGSIDLELTIKAVEVNPETHQQEFLLQVQDITERKKIENMKNEFINTISHEMRTPLTSIRESVIILKDHFQENLTSDQIGLLEITLRNINRLGKLIQDVLDFQKLNAVLMTFNQKLENINEIVSQIVKDLSSYTNTTNIEILTNLHPNIPLVKIDKERISQVLINLINNAIKYTKKGSVIIKTDFAKDMDKQQVKISVTDTGIGIRSENLEKIFTPFFQIKDEVEYQSGGTGLGLSISNKILEGHNSKLHVISDFGVGSTFYFFLQLD
jgi:PAS domain S-box-containing protein